MASIVEETGETLIRASHSTNIKERRDCSTALFNAAGETLCQAEHIPIHLGSFLDLIQHIMRRYPTQDIRPGDAFIGNDAYEGGGTHLPDIVLAEPIFIDGRLVAWTVNLAHHADFVDRGHAHIFQEGLRIPPVRLYRAGELQGDVQDLILLNCQVPRERLSDLRAQMAANRVGVQRFQALAAKYGTDDGAAGRRGADGLRRAQDARRHRRHARRHLALRGRVRQRGGGRAAAARRRGHGEGRCHVARLRRAGADARRHQHDLHGAARHDLLRREVGAGSRASRPTPAWRGRSASPRPKAAS